jgi:hypothetical protein
MNSTQQTTGQKTTVSEAVCAHKEFLKSILICSAKEN